jgi:hypothetical protein
MSTRAFIVLVTPTAVTALRLHYDGDRSFDILASNYQDQAKVQALVDLDAITSLENEPADCLRDDTAEPITGIDFDEVLGQVRVNEEYLYVYIGAGSDGEIDLDDDLEIGSATYERQNISGSWVEYVHEDQMFALRLAGLDRAA